MPWYLYIAFKQLFPTGRFISFFSLMSIIGVTLGVMVLLLVQSVMNGFQQQLKVKMVDTAGHFRIIQPKDFLTGYDAVIDQIVEMDGVEAGAPAIESIVMMQNETFSHLPVLRGIDLEREREVIPLDRFLVMGDYEKLDDYSIILSTGLARKLGATVGSEVDVYSPLMIESLERDEVLLPRSLEVVALFETEWEEVDGNTALCTLRTMQELFGSDDFDGVYYVAFRCEDDASVTRLAREAEVMYRDRGLVSYTWMELNENMLYFLRLEKTMIFFITFFIILISTFSICVSLVTAVVRKTREIGLLRAMGASKAGVAVIFCIQGMIVGTIGSIFGLCGNLLALQYRANIIHAIASVSGREDDFMRFYGFVDFPVQYSWSEYFLVMGLTIILATCAGLWPALKASLLKPSEALRYE